MRGYNTGWFVLLCMVTSIATGLGFGVNGILSPLLSSNAYAFQNGIAIEHYDNSLTYGLGLYFAPETVTVYSAPSMDSTPVLSVKWSPNSRGNSVFCQLTQRHLSAETVFLTFFPQHRIAAMAMVSENDAGWAEVVYDQRSGKTGWVLLREDNQAMESDSEDSSGSRPATAKETAHYGRFQSWLDFMKFNGRTAGIYWLSGVSEYHRHIRMQPDDKAKFLPVQVVRDIRVKHVRGNWMLIEVTDLRRQHPMGWVRWRDEAGRLMVFPNIANRSTPYVFGMF